MFSFKNWLCGKQVVPSKRNTISGFTKAVFLNGKQNAVLNTLGIFPPYTVTAKEFNKLLADYTDRNTKD